MMKCEVGMIQSSQSSTDCSPRLRSKFQRFKRFVSTYSTERLTTAFTRLHALHELPQVPPFFGAELCDVEDNMVIKGRGACDTKVRHSTVRCNNSSIPIFGGEPLQIDAPKRKTF